jgi:hypothetical protein
LYDYVEEEEEEEEFVSKSKKSSSKQNSDRNKKNNTPTASSVNRSRNLTRDKTSSYNDEDVNPEVAKQDIRTAFFRASATAKPKTEKKLDDGANIEDDLANEIMQELTNKKSAAPKPAARPKSTNLTPGRPQPFNIPFASNSPHITTSNTVLSLSPAHKRKLSPSKPQVGDHQQLSKKIELDDELVQQLFDSDSNQAASNTVAQPAIKSEPMCYEAPVVVKAEKIDYAENNEDDDDLALLSGLSLDGSNLSKHLNLPIKQESGLNSSGMELTLNNTNITMNDEIDLSAQIKNMDSSNKMLMYWLDAYEDQFNSNGTVYLFGKMPIATKQNATEPAAEASDDKQQLSFVSVCCIIKNIPKVIYVLPRKYRKSKVKREPGVSALDQRELVTMDDVRKDVDALMEKHKIFSYRVKTVKKCFPFDKPRRNPSVIDPDDEVPFESEYLQVEFQPDKHSTLNQLDSAEGECFSAVFNANASHLEHILVDLKLKGKLKNTFQNTK